MTAILSLLLLVLPGCQREDGTKTPSDKTGVSGAESSGEVNAAGDLMADRVVLSSDIRFYFTGALSPVEITQVLSMKVNGTGLLQHTTGGDVKYGINACAPLERVYFSRDEALAVLMKNGETKVLLSRRGMQYHSPRCSPDGKYLSVTAWDKDKERAYIEVYDADARTRKQRWEGEFASWSRNRNAVVYREVVQNEKPQRVDVFVRDMDISPDTAQLLHSVELGEYIYDLTEPSLIGPGPLDVVFRIYDEHEYFYYLNELGNPFVKTRNGEPLIHHDVYGDNIGDSLEQGALTVSPDGKLAVMEEHPWNTPPSIYLVDMKTRDSWMIAEGFNPTWSADSKLVLFNKDPKHYEEYHEAVGKGLVFTQIYPKSLNGYEIYVYDIELKKEYRLTDNSLYEGFL